MARQHARIQATGTWGGDLEGRDSSGRVHREITKALRQAVKCHCCEEDLVVGWLREDGVYHCNCCVEVIGRERCTVRHKRHKQAEIVEHIHVSWIKGANK